MDNPLEQPVPEDPIARAHEFARDLAWGVANGKWSAGFRVSRNIGGTGWLSLSFRTDIDAQGNLERLRESKWKGDFPESDLLQSFGYFEPNLERYVKNQPAFLLTPKAFALLEKPLVPPRIFISYRQAESSAFASLIEARLNIAAPEAGVFIDKLLEGGEEWERRIEREIRKRDTFILVYGKTTHESTMIRKEIAWARESDSRIIPVLHNGYTGEENYPEELSGIQWIAVETESAENYELAILKLLNTLGYPTLQSPRAATSAS
ncbi:MAG: TIR domain-containing protein [Anaerolineaceae bacterium]|nr:TIR domain-containing protein [Anaerolineaceae bacterium]